MSLSDLLNVNVANRCMKTLAVGDTIMKYKANREEWHFVHCL